MKTVIFRTRSFDNANEVVIKIKPHPDSKSIGLNVFCFNNGRFITAIDLTERPVLESTTFKF